MSRSVYIFIKIQSKIFTIFNL